MNNLTVRYSIQDGRVRTGDLGRFDEDGYLWFMGRKKDTIIRGGSHISPLEVEAGLLAHPAVAEICVIGVVDTTWGQVVHAFVVLQPQHKVSSEELQSFAKARLAEYMVPEKIHFLDEMPVKGPGKVDRDLLRMRAEIRPLIEKVALFRDASEGFIRDIVPHLMCRQFEATEILFRQGEFGDAMYFLTRGQVQVLRRGSREPVATLSVGACFGEAAILMDAPRLASVRAVCDCEVYELKRASVLKLMKAYPEFALHVNQALESYQPSAK